MMWRILAGPLTLCFLINAHAEENVPLKADVGRETVEAYCSACHSLDYCARMHSFSTVRNGRPKSTR
jgi:hypothetical protein